MYDLSNYELVTSARRVALEGELGRPGEIGGGFRACGPVGAPGGDDGALDAVDAGGVGLEVEHGGAVGGVEIGRLHNTGVRVHGGQLAGREGQRVGPQRAPRGEYAQVVVETRVGAPRIGERAQLGVVNLVRPPDGDGVAEAPEATQAVSVRRVDAPLRRPLPRTRCDVRSSRSRSWCTSLKI